MSLSSRGAASAASLDLPWRFAPGSRNPYDADSNPAGVVSFAMAENVNMYVSVADSVNYVVTNSPAPHAR